MAYPPEHTPPSWATRFFRWYCPYELREEIEGDLFEAFGLNTARHGLRKARLRYVIDVIRFCNPTTFQRARKLRPDQRTARYMGLDMLKNYGLIVWRTIRRRPLYALLNISGLTIGVAATLFILLYLQFELNYDRFHEQADEIYRIATPAIETNEKVIDVSWNQVPGNIGPLMKQEFPEVKMFMRRYSFFQDERVSFQYDGKTIKEEAVQVVDSSLFDMFTFPLVHGDPETALNGPNKIILSQDMAQRIFGAENPLGKLLTSPTSVQRSQSDTALTFVVSGVFRDMPRNTHWYVHALISAETDPELSEYYFNRFGFNTYVILHPETDPDQFAEKLSTLYDKHLDVEREPVLKRAIHSLSPLTEVHMEDTEGWVYIYIFSGIGLLILLISVISYVNLATAQASRRAMEVGLRKVLGSQKRQLIGQFLAESLLFTWVAVGMGVAIVVSTAAPVNDLLNLHLDVTQLSRGPMILGILAIVFLLGIVGGSYPAFFLSSFAPLTVLKAQWGEGRNRYPIRRVLVAVQFAIVMFVLVCTGMIYDQLRFIRQKELGFEQEHVIQLTLPTQDRESQSLALRQELSHSPWIESMSASSFIPGAGIMRGPISVETPDGPVQNFAGRGWISPSFWKTLEVPLAKGRNFATDMPTDTLGAVIINEALVHEFGLTDPVGTRIRLGNQGNPHFYEVVGVSRDFHQNSLHMPIMPQTIFLGGTWMPNLLVKVGGDLQSGMVDIEKSWAKVFPHTPLAYRFIDEMAQEHYEADRIRGKLFLAFSMLTLFIAFLGLFGLASYMATQRIREVGIRKVLGAGNWDLVTLLTRSFLIWVICAAVPAFVLAWYIMRQWLENFAFRTELNVSVFAMVLGFTLLFTFLVTGIHALRAARMNPADTLRGE